LGLTTILGKFVIEFAHSSLSFPVVIIRNQASDDGHFKVLQPRSTMFELPVVGNSRGLAPIANPMMMIMYPFISGRG
jgi:hypothetical protein